MSAQHTQGRLVACKPSDELHAIRDASGRIVADVGYSGTKDGDEAKARRLVACWNACEGISTEVLEGSMVTMLSKMGPGEPDSDGRMSAPIHYPIDCAEIRELATQRDHHIVERDQLLALARNFEVTGPDDDGLVWLVLRGEGTSGKAMFNLGSADRLVAQVALHLEADRRAAIAACQPQPTVAHLPADDTEGGAA
jgi:hypothetical protein